MTNRLNQLPGNFLASELSRLRLYADERKSAVQVIGGANVVVSLAKTANSYDWSGLLPASPQNPSMGTKVLRVTVTGQNMDNLYGSVFGKIWVGSPTAWYRPSNQLADMKAGLPSFGVRSYEAPPNAGSSKSKRWDFVITGDKTTLVYFKSFARVTDAVSFTMTELN